MQTLQISRLLHRLTAAFSQTVNRIWPGFHLSVVLEWKDHSYFLQCVCFEKNGFWVPGSAPCKIQCYLGEFSKPFFRLSSQVWRHDFCNIIRVTFSYPHVLDIVNHPFLRISIPACFSQSRGNSNRLGRRLSCILWTKGLECSSSPNKLSILVRMTGCEWVCSPFSSELTRGLFPSTSPTRDFWWVTRSTRDGICFLWCPFLYEDCWSSPRRSSRVCFSFSSFRLLVAMTSSRRWWFQDLHPYPLIHWFYQPLPESPRVHIFDPCTKYYTILLLTAVGVCPYFSPHNDHVWKGRMNLDLWWRRRRWSRLTRNLF